MSGFTLQRLRTLEDKLQQNKFLMNPMGSKIELREAGKKGQLIGQFDSVDELFMFVLGYEWGCAKQKEKINAS